MAPAWRVIRANGCSQAGDDTRLSLTLGCQSTSSVAAVVAHSNRTHSNWTGKATGPGRIALFPLCRRGGLATGVFYDSVWSHGNTTTAGALSGVAATATATARPTAGHCEELSIIPGFGSVPPKLIQNKFREGVCGHRRAPARVLAGGHGPLMLPYKASSPEPGDGHKHTDGMFSNHV